MSQRSEQAHKGGEPMTYYRRSSVIRQSSVLGTDGVAAMSLYTSRYQFSTNPVSHYQSTHVCTCHWPWLLYISIRLNYFRTCPMARALADDIVIL